MKTRSRSNEITFDADAHVYRDAQGRVVPGVTGIIRACGLMDTQWASEWHMQRGSAVHRAVELDEQGDLDEASLDSVIVPYLDAWRRFKTELHYISVEQERKIYHPVYRYAGTLDQIGILNDKSTLIDIKTGAYQPWWALQTAAYNAVSKCRYRYSIELHNDGKYKLIQHKKNTDLQAFLACLTVWNLRREYGRS
jgi:hypothetical protein